MKTKRADNKTPRYFVYYADTFKEVNFDDDNAAVEAAKKDASVNEVHAAQSGRLIYKKASNE